MRTLRPLILLFAVAGCASPDRSRIRESFAGDPPASVLRSENGTLEWRQLWGDRRFKHSDMLIDVAVAPDGEWIVALSGDQVIKVWEPRTGRVRTRLSGFEEHAFQVGVAPNGEWFASLHDGGTIRTWDAQTGRPLAHWQTLEAKSAAPRMSVSSKLVASCFGGEIGLFDPRTGSLRLRLPADEDDGALDVSLTPDGRLLATVGTSDDLVVWDVARARVLHRFRGPQSFSGPKRILDGFDELVELAPDGSEVAATTLMGPILRWSIPKGKPLPALQADARSVMGLRYSRDGRRILTMDQAGGIRVWSRATGELEKDLWPHPFGASCFDVGSDGTWYVTGGAEDCAVRRWQLEPHRELEPRARDGLGSASLHLIPGSDLVLVVTAFSVEIRNRNTGEPLRRNTPYLGANDQDFDVSALSVSEDGRRAVTSGEDDRVTVWGMDKLEVLAVASGFAKHVTSVALLERGTRWISTSYDGKLHSGRVAYRSTPEVWSSERKRYGGLVVSPRGTHFAFESYKNTGSESQLHIWSVAERTETHRIDPPGGPIWCLAFAPDERRLLCGTDTGMSVWNVQSGAKVLGPIGIDLDIHEAVWSEDGRWIYSLDKERLRVWDARAGTMADSIEVHGGPSSLVTKGYRIWVGGSDDTVSVYEHRVAKK